MNLKRYFIIYAELWKNSVTREMSFKGNFILWIVVELLWLALQLCFVSVVFSQTKTIGSWTQWQMVLLVGASNFIQQVYQAFFLVNCTTFPNLSARAKWIFFFFCQSTRASSFRCAQVDLGGFINAIFAIAVMIFAAGKLHLQPTILQLAAFGALCVVGILIHYSLMFMLAAISFWTVRAQGIIWGYYQLFNIARMPDEAFRGAFKAVFTLALPMLLVSNVPVRVLAAKIVSPEALLVLLALAVIWAAISEWFWRVSMRRYTSASS